MPRPRSPRGSLLALAFPALDWGPLALVALIPLLWAWQRSGPGRAALYGFLAGVAFFGVLLWWSVYFGAVAIVPFVVAQAAYWAGAGAVVGGLGRRGVRSPWITAAVWVVFEALRSRWPLGGFSWGQVGVALHDFPSPARSPASAAFRWCRSSSCSSTACSSRCSSAGGHAASVRGR